VVGSRGAQVKQLQRLLSQLGYFNAKELSSNFGSKTKSALLQYQLDKKIVSGTDAHGAGVYGPTTRKLMMADAINAKYQSFDEFKKILIEKASVK
jgi:peptidoglycan hydrolase-like protein with peptidoglycan-binding domain